MGNATTASDEYIRRLEKELSEKESLVRGIYDRANASNRDVNEEEGQMVAECRGRMEQIKNQMEQAQEVNRIAFETRSKGQAVDAAISAMRGSPVGTEVEYRSAGEYMLDMWNSAQGNASAADRLEVYARAADHQKTGDLQGVIPDPIVGPVIDFIDSARPLVSTLGTLPLNNATFYRPIVSQRPAVGLQGVAGGPSDEKSELDSQKMIIDRLTVNAQTLGGYVNVSRQAIDFSSPSALDLVVNGLGQQYAIETEALVGAALASTSTGAVGYGNATADNVAAAIWQAAGAVYTAVKGMGRLVIAIAPDVLGDFGPLFAPVNPTNSHSTGFEAGRFGQGVMGSISGIPVVMSAALGSGDAYLFSTAAIECFEQRVGTLQVVEPSVFGLQVAYAGYFSTLVVNEDAIVPLVGS
ncbi:major capsid protein [Mycobacterium phage Ryadel]|uniref:Major capsid protein n=1 Tax=Mycobacterium phage Ryadel TaxID=2283292 RepID=A0A345MF12_9CAUD|nr:major head protein [Mycobacterium phage Ryadel]AXH69143.1 major capsid protein [Mycobacterium phage Ryadel]